jgi:hypothetical protein
MTGIEGAFITLEAMQTVFVAMIMFKILLEK